EKLSASHPTLHGQTVKGKVPFELHKFKECSDLLHSPRLQDFVPPGWRHCASSWIIPKQASLDSIIESCSKRNVDVMYTLGLQPGSPNRFRRFRSLAEYF
ncbi:MAG: hypothetical protein ACREP9_08875, partial [Candidatus Dormibacteraceae bacterium]